ncbi:MAG: N(5)-(carboxyethyl)ornithine synthase [Deltaproteobacteria bacterium]|nr:N(5)-(carboxyethyl)ornithine synthase [Deltaproteobacteria bacterium]
MATIMRTGVIGTSLKKNEGRVPIHPDHFREIAPKIRARLLFEKGYGEPFGVSDMEIVELMGGVATRDKILADCDISIMCKPLAADLAKMKEGGVLWGWAHCVQQYDLTQAAIDRRLSLLTWEGMNIWGINGEWVSHVFYRNNEIAGYAGVLHAMGLVGIDGGYGPLKKAAVINFGSVGQGAVRALLALGFTDITVYVMHDPASQGNVPPGVKVIRITDQSDGYVATVDAPFICELEKMDVIVNAMLQDPAKPLSYLAENETERLKQGSLIIDVSCDEGMGFPFARPTSFEKPVIPVGNIHYYSVDHTPTYLWNSASWEISKALLPYLRTVMSGPAAWEQDETVRGAIEIREGVVINPQILSFQKRNEDYPHKA